MTLLIRKIILMSQMEEFSRKTSQLGDFYNPYLIFNPFLTNVANKCTIYVTTCCKKLQHSRANKQGNLVRYFKKKNCKKEYDIYHMECTICNLNFVGKMIHHSILDLIIKILVIVFILDKKKVSLSQISTHKQTIYTLR